MYTYVAHTPASTNSDIMYFSIFKQFVELLISYFPPSFFKSVIIDNKSVRKNFYNINSDGRISTIQNSHELKIAQKSKPYINVSFKRNINNHKDVWGGLSQAQQYASPIAYALIDQDKGMHTKMLIDNQKKIYLYTNELYNSVSFDINIVVSSMADQESVQNILYSDVVSDGFTKYLCKNLEIMIPNFLFTIMREVLYKNEIEGLSNNTQLSKQESDNLIQNIDEALFKYMHENSNGSIKKYHDFSFEGGNDDLLLCHKRDQYIHYALQQFSTGEGEKKGNVFTSFTLSSSGTLETFSPTNFTFEFPDYVNGIFVDDKIMRSNFYNNILLHDFKKFHKFRRDRHPNKLTPYAGFDLFLDEIDLTFDKDGDPNDKSINIRDILIEKICRDPREKKIYLAFLETYEAASLDAKKSTILVDIYKDYNLITMTDIGISNGCELEYETLNVTIKDDIDFDSLYSVRVFIQRDYYTEKIQKKITTL